MSGGAERVRIPAPTAVEIGAHNRIQIQKLNGARDRT